MRSLSVPMWRPSTHARASAYEVFRVKRNGMRVSMGRHSLVMALKIAGRLDKDGFGWVMSPKEYTG